ncbi:MAG TPA: hypothetical protein VGE52_20075 [Pirellulales bacterium]
MTGWKALGVVAAIAFVAIGGAHTVEAILSDVMHRRSSTVGTTTLAVAVLLAAIWLAALVTPRWLKEWSEWSKSVLGFGLFALLFVAACGMESSFSQGGLVFTSWVGLAVVSALAALIVFVAACSWPETDLEIALKSRDALSQEAFVELFFHGDAALGELAALVCESLDEAVGCGDLTRLRPDDPIRDLYYNPKADEGIPEHIAYRLKHQFGCRITEDELMNPELTLPMLVKLVADRKSRGKGS